ncbi:MAG: glycoside hydrolase family 10 protein [Armatimonadota bacterium]
MIRGLSVPLALLLATSAIAQNGAVLEVRGRGAEGGPGYEEGGVVEFQSVSLAAQVLHYDGSAEFRLPLAIAYEVLETAPITLNSRFGSEYWRLYHFGRGTMSRVHTHEDINLSEEGLHVTLPADLRAWFDARYGGLPDRGLVGIRGHHYFLIDPIEGDRWLDIVSPPAFFETEEVSRRLTFTLADLSAHEIAVDEVQSTWEAGGPIRVRVTVTDARGDVFPVVNAPLVVHAGDTVCVLETQWGALSEPTGWLAGTLPDEVPAEVTISGQVVALGPDGAEITEIDETVQRGAGRVSADQMRVAELGYELPRTDDGTVRETRGLWVGTGQVLDREGIDLMVERASQARLNVLLPDIFYRNTLLARSELMPISDRVAEGFDPLAYMIERAHEAGIEMHPWFCINYRSPAFSEWFEETYGEDVRMYDVDGEVVELAVDVHREAYRDFVVDLVVGVARDYDVDGIHLDYIRTRGRCFCEYCRVEFEEQVGVPLTEATDEQWIEWQREAIGEIVRRTGEAVHAVRPDAIVSAAVFSSETGGASQGQDPVRWAREGWVDLVIPMDYSMQSLEVRANERRFLDALDDGGVLCTGLSIYQSSGGRSAPRSPELVREQIEMVRAMGIRGYALFSLSHLSDEQIEMLGGDVNAEEAVPFFR